MTNRDKVIAYLRSVHPAEAKNGEILRATGIKQHQQVFPITQALLRERVVEGRQGRDRSREWTFRWAGGNADASSALELRPVRPGESTTEQGRLSDGPTAGWIGETSVSIAPQGGSEKRRTWITVGPDGRLVIPIEFRRALGIDHGGDVLMALENGELRLVGRDAAIRRAQAIVARHVPRGVSLVDELIAERRDEAAREEQEST